MFCQVNGAKVYFDTEPGRTATPCSVSRGVPLYRAKPDVNPTVNRSIVKSALAFHFNVPNNEQGRLDFRADLAKVRCPILVMGGDRDPAMPIQFAETIAASLPAHLTRFERFEGCGHVPCLNEHV